MRLERLLALLVLLLNRRRISAKELAERMEVSVRTIYRDIEALGHAGIPVVTYPGTNGGVGIMDGYRIDRSALTYDEIATIVTALKSVGKTLDDAATETTLAKFSGLLNEQEQSQARSMYDQLVIDIDPWGQHKTMKAKVAELRLAIAESRLIRFRYTKTDGVSSQRQVEPVTLLLKGTTWYLHGFCRDREELRLFRLTRLSDLELTDEHYARRGTPPAQMIEWESLRWHHTDSVAMTLRFRPEARVRVEEYFGAEMMSVDAEGWILVQETYPEDEWVYGFILGFGDLVEVLAPERLRTVIREKALRIVRQYER